MAPLSRALEGGASRLSRPLGTDASPNTTFFVSSRAKPTRTGPLDGKKSKENKLSPTSVILSSWFLALVMFGLVFLAGTAIGAAFSSSKAPATTLATAEKPHVPHAQSHAHARAPAHAAHASKPKPLTKEQKLEKWYAEADAEVEATDAATDSDSTDSATSPALALPRKTGKKSSSAKAEAAVGVAPKRVTGADARAVFDAEVNPARNAKNLIGDRERAAKQSMFADIKRSLSRDSSRVASALGHSFTPVRRSAKSLRHDPEAPTTMEMGAREYAAAFAEFSAAELLAKAHDLLAGVDKYELLAAKIDQDALADALLELDAAPSAEPIADVIKDEIFASEVKSHSWESDKRRAARKLLGGNALTEKSSDQYAAEFGDALRLGDDETLDSVLPAAAARAPAAIEAIFAKGENASDDEKSLVAAYHLMAICARAAPAPIGADVPRVFRPAWEVLLAVLEDVDASAFREAR